MPKPLFQSEAKCEAIDMKMSFYSHANKTHLASAHFGSKSFWNSEMVHVYSMWGLSLKVVNAFFVFTLVLFCLF